jgi:hypothetical protein
MTAGKEIAPLPAGEAGTAEVRDLVLAKVDGARRLLAEVTNAEEARRVASVARAAEVYARRVRASQEVISQAVAIKVDAMTLMGEHLEETPKSKGGRPAKTGPLAGPVIGQATLADLGIPKNESADSQTLARMARQAPDDHARVRAGEVSVRAAAASFRRRKCKAARARVEAEVASVETSGRWMVERADCLDWLAGQPADSVHLVFGSPPYEQARLYLENGEDKGIALGRDEWVEWMVRVYKAALRCCTGLVALSSLFIFLSSLLAPGTAVVSHAC